ncbi:MAG: hypothetical protein H0T79_08150, partial [Deltaproteobacteria bacterium]|nr:hypothetical protein [Deltaproteobacteria bacterium]
MPGQGRVPSRSLLIPGALLTQIVGSTCILLGTVAFALTITGGDRALMPVLIGWVVAALSAVVCGGLVYRGNLPSLVIVALLDGVFGVVLFQLSRTLGGLLRMLSPADVDLVSTV